MWARDHGQQGRGVREAGRDATQRTVACRDLRASGAGAAGALRLPSSEAWARALVTWELLLALLLLELLELLLQQQQQELLKLEHQH